MSFLPASALSIGSALLFSSLFTPLTIRLAHARGWIVKPRADRWHRKPTALMGGIAIFTAFLLANLFVTRSSDPWVLAACTLMFGVGLYDDLHELKPFVKLFGQILVALLLVLKGYVFGGGMLGWFGIPLTFLWVIGITNAINLLDNMDGLAAGITSIVSLASAVLALQNGNADIALFGLTLAGACLGFLFFNFNPASIFMGDSGSLFLGFALSFLSLAVQQAVRNSVGALVLLVPVGLMAIPIMDTTLVTVRRILSGRRIDQGGRDHSSHRLVALGLSERKAVLLLYALSAVWGVSIFLLSAFDIGSILLILLLLTIFTVVFAFFLSSVRVYNESEERMASLRSQGEQVKNVLGIRFLLMNKKLILGVAVDMAIVTISFLAAARTTQFDLRGDFRLLALSIPLKILAFHLFNLYNRVWRYVATHELLGHLYAVLLSSLFLLCVNRYMGFGPRMTNSFFITDFFFTLGGLIFSRLLWRALREYFDRTAAAMKKRALIYGAGDAGYMLVREIIQNYAYGLTPVGFIDDDKSKRNMSIAGIRIYGGLDELPEALKKTSAQVVVTSMRKLDDTKLERLREMTSSVGVPLKRFEVGILDVLTGDECERSIFSSVT